MAKTPTKIQSLARSHTETAVTTLAKIMTSTKAPPAARVAAANALLDRGWGKPQQSMTLNDERPGDITEYTDEELTQIIVDTVGRVDRALADTDRTEDGTDEPDSVH